LIVDDSGSMAQHVTGGRKIDVAKQVLPGLIQDYARRRPNCGPDLRPPAPVARTRLL
jgi:hypothetical protein